MQYMKRQIMTYDTLTCKYTTCLKKSNCYLIKYNKGEFIFFKRKQKRELLLILLYLYVLCIYSIKLLNYLCDIVF